MDKTEFLETLQTEHAAWEAQLSRVKPGQMTQPGVVGEWSVKDLVAHITWSEREMVGVLEAMALVGSDLWSLSNDERNAITYEQDRYRPLEEVLAEERNEYQHLVKLVSMLSERALNDPSAFKDMPADWVPWRVFMGNTYKHYREHSQDLKRWLDSQ